MLEVCIKIRSPLINISTASYNHSLKIHNSKILPIKVNVRREKSFEGKISINRQ